MRTKYLKNDDYLFSLTTVMTANSFKIRFRLICLEIFTAMILCAHARCTKFSAGEIRKGIFDGIPCENSKGFEEFLMKTPNHGEIS